MANKIVPQTLNSSGVYDKLITAISSGGTGAESESAAVKNLISGLTSTTPASNDLIPFQDVSSGGAGKTTLSALASALQSVRGYAKIQTGSYVGTGTYGANNPCSLTFDSEPKILWLLTKESNAKDGTNLKYYWKDYFVYNQNYIDESGSISARQNNVEVQITWNNNSLSWYCSYRGSSSQSNYVT